MPHAIVSHWSLSLFLSFSLRELSRCVGIINLRVPKNPSATPNHNLFLKMVINVNGRSDAIEKFTLPIGTSICLFLSPFHSYITRLFFVHLREIFLCATQQNKHFDRNDLFLIAIIFGMGKRNFAI